MLSIMVGLFISTLVSDLLENLIIHILFLDYINIIVVDIGDLYEVLYRQ